MLLTNERRDQNVDDENSIFLTKFYNIVDIWLKKENMEERRIFNELQTLDNDYNFAIIYF